MLKAVFAVFNTIGQILDGWMDGWKEGWMNSGMDEER
jgi:hypothetical protein